MLEKHIEQTLGKAARQRGGLSLKWVAPGTAGVPDRIIILPNGRVGFIELKKPGGRLRPIQKHRINQLTKLGVPVHIIDHPDQIGPVLNAIQTP